MTLKFTWNRLSKETIDRFFKIKSILRQYLVQRPKKRPMNCHHYNLPRFFKL